MYCNMYTSSITGLNRSLESHLENKARKIVSINTYFNLLILPFVVLWLMTTSVDCSSFVQYA